MSGNDGSSWDYCKLIEEQENGELKLLKENLTQLMSKLNKPEFQDIPIVLLSIVGEKQSGKSFYTNLIAEHLNFNGKSWTKGMKVEGLKGFAFGGGEMRVSAEKVDGIFEPGEEEHSGVYFWPELFLLEQCTGKKLLWIMHMYDGQREENISDGPVTNFVKVASSRLVDIIWKDESVPGKLQESVGSHPLSSNFCQSKVYLWRGSLPSQPTNQTDTGGTVIKISESPEPLHDEKGIVNLPSRRQLSVEKFIKTVINDQDLKPVIFRMDSNSSTTHIPLTINLIENGLKWFVDLVNDSSSSMPVQHQEASDFQQIETKTEATVSKVITNFTDNQSKHNKPGCDMTSVEPRGNSQTPHQSKSKVEPDSFQDTHQAKGMSSAHTQVLNKYEDEEYFSARCWKRLRKSLNKWMHKKLTIKNTGEMINIFNGIAPNIAQTEIEDLERKGIPSAEAIRVIKIEKIEENVLKFKVKIEILQGELMKFCFEMDAQFQKTPYFPQSELAQIFEIVQNQIKTTLQNKEIEELFDAGCKKLIPEYVKHNAIIENETKLLLEGQQQVIIFYQEEMGRVLKSDKFQIPANLQNIHDRLALELQRVFQDSVDKDPNSLDKLSKQLDKEFQTIRQKNLEKITSVQRRINNLIVQMKSDYEIEMDALLEANEDGVEPCKFTAEHSTVEMKVIKTFKELLRSEVRVGEPVDMHLKTLAAHVDKSREDFEEENEENLKASKEKTNERETENKAEKTAVKFNAQAAETARDQPLFFHLTYSQIGISVSNVIASGGDQDIIYVPAYVGFTTNNEWVMGNDYAKAASEDRIAMFLKIGEFYNTSPNNHPGRETASYGIKVDSEILQVTLQLLLSIFFANYKHKFEHQFKCIFSRVMIAVPFWFPSSQRQQILEATQLAGFECANLFNENSSAAYFMYSSGLIDPKTSQQCNALIISENSNRVDMSLYFYNKRTRKLKIKGHTGDYEEDLKKVSNVGGPQTWSTGVIGVLITFARALGSKFSKKSAEENAVKKLTEKLADMCSHSNNITNIQNSEVVIMTESTDWLDLLGKVGDQVNPYATRDGSRFAILGLASIFEAMQNDAGREMANVIEDGIPFYLNIYPPNGGTRCKLQHKSDTLARKPQYELKSIFEAVEGPYRVIQENASWKMHVGLLIIKKLRLGCTNIKISIERTHDGILELKKVEWLQITAMSNLTRKIGEFEPEEFSWITNKMSTDILNRYSMYLNSIYPNSGKLAKLKDLKEKAISFAQELERAIVTDRKGSFPSEIIKTLTLKTIRDAGTFPEGSSEPCEDDVKQKINILERLKSDYKIH